MIDHSSILDYELISGTGSHVWRQDGLGVSERTFD
jgi:hypothetical protein